MPQNRIKIVDVADTLGLSSMASKESNPSLTTIHQEANLRAKTAIECLEAMRDGAEYKTDEDSYNRLIEYIDILYK